MANGFWSQTGLEPKRQFRWLLYLSGMPQFIVSNVKKPTFTVGSVPYNFLNYEFKYPGRVTWQPISFTIIDPVQPDSAQSLFHILENSGYVLPNNYQEGEGGPKTISKQNMVQSLGTQIKISQIDDLGDAIETWTLNNPQLTQVDFGNLDYSQEGMVNIAVTVAYDWASIETFTPANVDNKWDVQKPDGTPSGNFAGDDFATPTILD